MGITDMNGTKLIRIRNVVDMQRSKIFRKNKFQLTSVVLTLGISVSGAPRVITTGEAGGCHEHSLTSSSL